MSPKSAILSTMNGSELNLSCPDFYRFTPLGIITPLSRICRFGAQTRRFYSVAEHSVMVSLLTEQLGGDPWGALWHDSAEAFMGDVITPLKEMLPDYGTMEDRLVSAIGKQFGFAFPFDKQIHHADLCMLDMEGSILIPGWKPKISENFSRATARLPLSCLSPAAAGTYFYKRMKELQKRKAKTLEVNHEL